MNNQEQNPNAPISNELISKSHPVYKMGGKDSHGGLVWQPGLLVRKVNRFDANTPEDVIFTLQVAYDPKNDLILGNTVPPILRNELSNKLFWEENSDIPSTGIIQTPPDNTPINWGDSNEEKEDNSNFSWGDNSNNNNTSNDLNIQWK